MKTIEISEEAYDLLEECIGHVDNYSDAIIAQHDLIQDLLKVIDDMKSASAKVLKIKTRQGDIPLTLVRTE